MICRCIALDYEQLFGSARRAIATFVVISCAIVLVVVLANPGRRLLREGDLDFDGRTDYFEYDTNHDGSADIWVRLWLGMDGVTKEIVTEEKDLDYDGKVDRKLTTHYPAWYFPNTSRMLEEDRTRNGRMDHRTIWINGKKAGEVWLYDKDGDGVEEFQEEDEDGDGQVDYWSWHYWIASVGEVIPGEPYNYVERDLDMDGSMDTFAVLQPTGDWLETNSSMLS